MARTLHLGRGPAWSSGSAQYAIMHKSGAFQMVVAARCMLGKQRTVEWAMVDTGAQWSVIGGDTAEAMTNEFSDSDADVVISTRFGRLEGRLHKLEVTLVADEGESLQVLATVAVLPEWRGPIVLGYQGFWERIRLGLDPGSGVDEPWLFFGEVR